jgi:hypothetical protein
MLWILCFLILFAGITISLLYRAAASTPPWYLPPDSVAASQPARDAENVLIDVQTWAGARYAWDYARSTGRRPLAKEPDSSLTITLTETQVNALLQKWFLIYSQETVNGRPLRDTLHAPMVHFTSERITFAATLLDVNSRIMSIAVRPELLPGGQLSLQLLTIHAGTLPLPEFTWSKPRAKLLNDLSRQLPALRGKATIDGGGGANTQCIAATCAAQAIAALQRLPTSNVLFFPVLPEGIALPAHIESIDLQDGALTLTVQAMTLEQRQQLLTHLRSIPAD